MTRLILSLFALSLGAFAQPTLPSTDAKSDPGKQVVGMMKGSLIYATNGAPENGATPLNAEHSASIAKETKLDYKQFYRIGEDQSPVYRSYEEWLQPIKGSKALMLSYEPKSISAEGIKFDLKFWQNSKKTLSTVNEAKFGEPLIIIGPSWREGKLLYILELKK